jgi:predicted acyltransferase
MAEAQQGRLRSLDIFRGATIAAMILVNNPGSDSVYPPLEHAPWHGWTFTDTVFPFFLWIVGVSMVYSTAKRLARGDSKSGLLQHAARRAVLLFLIGFILGPFPFIDWATIRIPGVLQRIAVCYFLGFLIWLYTSIRGQIAWIVALLASYWILMTLYPVPGYGPGVLEPIGNFAQYIDGLLLSGHMWRQTKIWDPEGIVSTLPAIATVLFGGLAGGLLRAKLTEHAKAAWLMSAGLLLMGLGHLLSFWLPINKNIWTSTYSIFMAGLAAAVLGVWYWLVDVNSYYRQWMKPLEIFGSNAILMFVLSGSFAKFMSRVKTPGGESLHAVAYGFFLQMLAPINASLAYALLNVAVLYTIAYALYRKRWFLKL